MNTFIKHNHVFGYKSILITIVYEKNNNFGRILLEKLCREITSLVIIILLLKKYRGK